MKIFTKEVRIAIVAIVGLTLLFFGMNFLKGLNLFSSTNDYYIEFDDITGLSSSSPIYAGGFQVGTVKGIQYDYSNSEPTKVLVALNKQMQIPEGTKAKIQSDMLGNVKIDLVVEQGQTKMLKPGGIIKGTIDGGAMGKMAAMIPAVEKILPKLDSIMGSLNALLADPAVAQTLHNVNSVTADLTVTTKQLNKLMTGLNRDMPAMMKKVGSVLDNTEAITANLAAVDVDATMKKVDRTIANVEGITAKLNSNEGSLGLLMNDPALYNNLNSTMMHADSLLINLREHPKRYVHFSLFGRKDK